MRFPESSGKRSIIGIDIGGTKIAGALVHFPEGTTSGFRTVPTEATRGGTAVLNEVAGLASSLSEGAKNGGVEVSGIGIGICEIVDRAGEIRSQCSLDWSSEEVKKRLVKFGQIKIEADVRAAALAEAHFGAGRGSNCFLYVTVGTGISCCLVLDGKPYLGARGATGTMASGPLLNFSREKEGDSKNTLEEIASGPAIVRRCREMGCDVSSGEQALAAAEAGEKRAGEVVRSGARALGGTIGALVNVLDPELVIIGGGLGGREGLYRQAIVESFQEHIWWPGHRDLSIISAQTGAMAGVIGAAAAVAFKDRP